MIYQFGDCTLDAAREEMRRSGEVINVEPQAFKVLLYLLEHHERVVSRDELFEQCWPESHVSDATLTSCLRRVRQAIGQTRTSPTLIETVHRRGYRFVAEVSEVVSPEAPVGQGPPSSEPPALMPESPESDGPIILVVDDDANSRELLERQLYRSGYATRSASNGQEALDQVAAEAPDLILLDVRMPVLDGFTVCRQLKGDAATRSIPIIVLTALDAPQDHKAGFEAGADACLTKPIQRQALLARLETALNPITPGDDPSPETPSESADTAPLLGTDPPPATPESVAITERRHLSVLSCTLADAAALSLRLDPEDHYDIVQTFRSRCQEIVSHHGGHVAQQLDDGVLVYFGYPQAREDDAQRAVRSGLALVEVMQRGAQANVVLPRGTTLAVRVGIATGIMVVALGGASHSPPSPGVGSASTLAVRLGALAPLGTVVISEATAQLVARYFECKVLEEAVLLEGLELGSVYEVRGESALQTRLEVEYAHGLTPFVGREAEVALFQERWTYVQEGMGQMVLVQGEAGMGKSRLVQVVKEQMIEEVPLALEHRCSPYHQNTALYPIIDLLQRVLQGQSATSPSTRLERLEGLLAQYDVALEGTVPLLAGLLSLPLPQGRYAPLSLTPQHQRERTLETLLSFILVQASKAPLLFVMEDVHWADPSTWEFLQLLTEHVATASMLVVLTSRSGFVIPWGQRAEIMPVVLNRLTRVQTQQLITQVAGGRQLSSAVLEQLIEKTDGVPLFIEELTRMVLESGQLVERDTHYEPIKDVTELTIPATLHDSLMARLDRLGTAKDIAQWGSVLGREFSYEVLEAVTPYDDETLQEGLRQLVEAELVFQRGFFPQTRYRFKHALIQEAAYYSLLRRRRQAMHHQIAQALETQFTEVVETQSELLAHHYTEAGQDEAAVNYWQQAGHRALQHSASQEAIAHLSQGLALLMRLPATPVRLKQELDLQAALGPALIAAKGYAAPDVELAYGRARELCQNMGDTPQLIPVLRGLLLYYLTRGDLQTASQLGEYLLRLAHAQPDPALLMLAHLELGLVMFFRGEPATASTHHTQAVSIYSPQEHQDLAFRYGMDLGVGSRHFLARELWQLGYPDQALQHSQEALRLAREVSHPYSLAFALLWTAGIHQFSRNPAAAHEQAEAAMTLSIEQGFPHWLARATTLHGWALAMQGQSEAGIAAIRQGLAAELATGSEIHQPYILGLLAEAYGESGRLEEALHQLAEALAAMEATEVRFYGAELYRLKGALLLRQTAPDASQAQACFHQALDIARHQHAKSWELRAAISLARLWHQQGKRHDAYHLLAPVYQWFTEGFDTADLQEAKALLSDLET